MESPIKAQNYWAVGRSKLALADNTEEYGVVVTIDGHLVHLDQTHARLMAAALLQCSGAAFSVFDSTEKEAAHG